MLAGRYELDQEIGRGAMGAVWRAQDTLLGRTVAIKQLGRTGGSAPDLARSQREAHLAASLTHHNVVSVFDLVDDDGWQWLVMELVDGPTLRDRIDQTGMLEPAELTPMLRQVASALAAAHSIGIVHRDVKPSNILLTRDGVPKLSDFGIARGQADLSLTQTGLVTGSPAYLAPEIATGRPATPASDVWSLGTTAFHALTGQRPYGDSEELLSAMYRIVHEEPPRLTMEGPTARLVESMMQRDPDDRPTMSEIESALLDIENAPSVQLAPDSDPTATRMSPVVSDQLQPDRRRLLIGAGAAAAIIAIVAIVLIAGRDSPDADTPRAAPVVKRTPEPAPIEPSDGATTAGALEGFVADYLTTASNDPRAGYELLTPKFQRESGGYRGYKGFWGRVSGLNVKDVTADPENLTVSYTYSYERDGDRRTDDVVLRLEESADGYLIAGEA